jgi:hypothetical protein
MNLNKAEDKLLISRLRELRNVKPEKEWVSSAKLSILGQEEKRTFLPFFQPALAGVTFALALLVFGFAQNSLPGDLLYSLKRVSEDGRMIFVSDQIREQINLEMANKRLTELALLAEKNETGRLPQAINEFQDSIAKLATDSSDESDPVKNKEMVDKMANEMQTVMAYLGADIGGEEFEELKERTDTEYVKYLIADMNERSLTESQQDVLKQMIKLAEQGEYLSALELYLTSQQ